jgi:hypothetical protein
VDISFQQGRALHIYIFSDRWEEEVKRMGVGDESNVVISTAYQRKMSK